MPVEEEEGDGGESGGRALGRVRKQFAPYGVGTEEGIRETWGKKAPQPAAGISRARGRLWGKECRVLSAAT